MGSNTQTKVNKTKDGILEKISAAIKSTLVNVDETQMYSIMRSHYETLNLINKDGVWVSPKFTDRADTLLPKDMTYEKVCLFIDEMIALAKKNDYLMHFMKTCSKEKFSVIEEKFKEEGKQVLPDVMGYTIILQNLTKECADDYKMLEELYNCFKKLRDELGAFKELPLFHKIKLVSVELPMKTYFKFHKTGVIPPKSGGNAVAINILEATWTDYKTGFKGNAKTGWILAKNKCGSPKHDERTGAGPSGWSKDGKMIERVYPFPTEWASLYQTWNMCFVTRFQDFLYVIPKLLIPQVADYYEKPHNYIYNRAIALYIYLNFASFDYVEKKKSGEKVINWHDRKLSLLFGESNAAMAGVYQSKVQKATK